MQLANDTGENNNVVIVDAVRFAYRRPPIITNQPQSQIVMAGGNATFTVAAGGETPLLYQWRFNDAPLTGANANWLSLTNVQPADAALTPSKSPIPSGATTSADAVLTVNVPSVPSQFESSGRSKPVSFEPHSRIMRRCQGWGRTNSVSSDWRQIREFPESHCAKIFRKFLAVPATN